MTQEKCVGCDKPASEISWPLRDASTGWLLCDNCEHSAKAWYRSFKRGGFNMWLAALIEVRKENGLK